MIRWVEFPDMCQIDLRSYVSSEHVIHFLRSKSSPDLLDGHFDICLSFPVPFNVNYFNSYTHVLHPIQIWLWIHEIHKTKYKYKYGREIHFQYWASKVTDKVQASVGWDYPLRFITCPALLTEMVYCIFKWTALYNLSSFIKWTILTIVLLTLHLVPCTQP